MFKQSILACAVFSLFAHSAFAAPAAGDRSKEAKPAPAPAPEQTAKAPAAIPAPPPVAQSAAATLEESKSATKPASKHNAKWSNPKIDLTSCLEKGSNEAVIKCAE